MRIQPRERLIVALDVSSVAEAEALAHMLSNDGRGMLYLPFLNYAGGSLDPSYEMLRHPYTMPGLSDGGAHVGTICDGSYPTYLLTHWGRDRTRGERLPLEFAVHRYTRAPAELIGLYDRGLIAPGMKADVVIFNPATVKDMATFEKPHQYAVGVSAVIVNGEVALENGKVTGARAGRALRRGEVGSEK